MFIYLFLKYLLRPHYSVLVTLPGMDNKSKGNIPVFKFIITVNWVINTWMEWDVDKRVAKMSKQQKGNLGYQWGRQKKYSGGESMMRISPMKRPIIQLLPETLPVWLLSWACTSLDELRMLLEKQFFLRFIISQSKVPPS